MIDRRQVVLGIAVAASLGTGTADDEPPEVYLFEGQASAQPGPFTLDAATPERVWKITAQVVLPSEATHIEFDGAVAARVRFIDTEAEYDPVTYGMDDCAGKALGQALEVTTAWEPIPAASHDAFAGCVPETPCTRTVCMDITTSNDEAPVEMEWVALAWVVATIEAPDGKAIDVPIELMVEEIEP